MDSDGEFSLLERTIGMNFDTIFDVGANVGRWAQKAAEVHPNATIHCFEIVPDTFSILLSKLK